MLFVEFYQLFFQFIDKNYFKSSFLLDSRNNPEVMIVNPQLFNYRLIIGALAIAIVVLGSYSFSTYQTLKNHQDFLEQEAHLVQNELSQMIQSYDEVKTDNKELNQELKDSKTRMELALDSLNIMKADASLISKYKSQLAILNSERTRLFKKIKSIQVENDLLQTQVDSVSNELVSKVSYIKDLELENHYLTTTLSKVEALSADNVHAEALNSINFGTITTTDKLNKLDHIEVCATLLSNKLTPIGNKEIYVQILNPQNEVVEPRGSISNKTNTLTYSGKTTIQNISDEMDVCTKININSKANLTAGVYKIFIFQDMLPLGATEMELN